MSNSRIVVSSPHAGGSCSAVEGLERFIRSQPLNPLEQPRIQLRDAPPGWQPAHPLLDHKLSPDEQAKALYALGLPTPEEATAEILRVRGEPVEVQKGPDQRPYTKPHATTVLDLTGERSEPSATPWADAMREIADEILLKCAAKVIIEHYDRHKAQPEPLTSSKSPMDACGQDTGLKSGDAGSQSCGGAIFDPHNPAHLAVQHSATFFNQGDSPVNDTDA